MYWTLELASHLEDAPWPSTKDELIDELCNWSGDLLSYYEFCNEFKYSTSAENRKRGRPKKLALAK